jgi:hypothetical protein
VILRRYGMVALLVCAAATLHAATSYRMTITRKDRYKLPPSIERVIVDGEKRRLTVENAEPPFVCDVLLTADGGRTVIALNTPLKTWFDNAADRAKLQRPIGLAPWVKTETRDAKISIVEEPADETIDSLPVRKFVIRAGYTTIEDFSGTKVKRIHGITTLLWATDKLDRSLGFQMPPLETGVESLDAELHTKVESIIGFPLRRLTTASRAYEGGESVVEILKMEVDDIRTVPSPPQEIFVKPAGYVNQAPVIGALGKL